MPLRIAHFVQRYPPALGGSEAYFARLSRYLVARGDHVTVFTTVADSLESFWSPHGSTFQPGRGDMDGVEIHRFPLSMRFRGRRWLLKPLSLFPNRQWQCATIPCNPLSMPMWRACDNVSERFDVVHATAFPYAFPILCAQRLARRLGVPFLLTPFLHLGDAGNSRDATRRAYTSPALMSLAKAADLVFAQTRSEQAALVEHGVFEQRIVLQGLGVDSAECTGGNRQKARHAWGVTESDVVIGHLANNSAEKGTIDLLQAADLLWRQGLSFRVMLAGPEMPSFRRFWQTYGRQEGVVRLGVLTDKQKRDFFAAIDVFALPSRSDSFGLVLLEAWANGVPNVAYRAGGIADVVRHEQDGLLAPCGEVAALADALRRLLTNAAFRHRLGEVGHARTQSEFRWDDKLALVREAYRQVATEVAAQRSSFRDSHALSVGPGAPP